MTLPSYLYVPNLIGYGRVAAMLASFACALSDWRLFVAYYLTAQLLDAFDGIAGGVASTEGSRKYGSSTSELSCLAQSEQ